MFHRKFIFAAITFFFAVAVSAHEMATKAEQAVGSSQRVDGVPHLHAGWSFSSRCSPSSCQKYGCGQTKEFSW